MHQLHGDVQPLGLAAQLVDLHHVGVGHLGGQARLVDEHGNELAVGQQRWQHAFDGDEALEPLHT